MKRNLQKGILVTSACAAFLLGNVQQAYAVAADAIEIVQQNKKIAGTVVDQNGEAVIGANVIQKGTTNGTITDIDGKFTLEVPAKAVLTVSFIGYQSQEVTLKGNETQLTVTLKDDTEVLDEVVVVGYGTMKKRDLSGAVSQIKSDDLMKGNPTDLSQGLAGKVAGVQINAADGAPGGGVSIQVRGTNSFSTSSQPLFIVDGVPFDAGSTPASDANQNNNEGSGQNGINGKAGQSDNWYMGITTESLFTFDKTFGVHGINAVAGFTAEKTNWGSKSMSATGFPNDLTQDYDMSLGTKPGKLQSDRGDAALASFLGRINYTLLDKYIFTASYRTDGSSKFTDANKWAGFLSGAFAWRMSEEKFIKNLNLFSNLKFRASYGETGNQGIGSYRTLPMLSVANYPFAGGINSGFAQVDWRGPVADDLRWETTAQYNVGLDMGFLNGRINLTVDYYHKKTRDLLQEVKIPLSTGFANMMVNSGYVTNEGLEISGKFYLLQNTPLKWNIDANISFNKNQIGGLEADQFATRLWYKADEVFLQRNGCPIGTIFGYVEDGFYDNLAEVMADPDPAVRAKGQKMIGEIKYRNFDDNPAITNADRVIIGDTNPDFVYGITNNFSWKNFTLSFFFQGSQGNDIFNGNLMDVKMGNVANIPQAAYDTRWTPETTAIAQWPKAVSSYERNMLISDRYVEDGSYLKLKNLNIGYNWANPFKGIKNLNFYASATNLFTITDYSWFDPEVNAFGSDASRRGVDIYSYPSSRTYSIGMKVTF